MYCVQTSSFLFVGMWSVWICEAVSLPCKHRGGSRALSSTNFSLFFTFVKLHPCPNSQVFAKNPAWEGGGCLLCTYTPIAPAAIAKPLVQMYTCGFFYRWFCVQYDERRDLKSLNKPLHVHVCISLQSAPLDHRRDLRCKDKSEENKTKLIKM